MRKIYGAFLIIITLFVATLAHAGSCCCCPRMDDYCYLDNIYFGQYPYIGIMAGIIQPQDHVRIFTDFPFIDDSTTFNSVKGIAGVALGYATRWDHWYVALEGSSEPFYINATKDWVGPSMFRMPYRSEVKINNYLNVDIIPGFYFTRCFKVYLRGGAAFAKIDLHQDDFLGTGINENVSNAQAGTRYGVGADLRVCRNLSVGVDYVYTDYNIARFSTYTPFMGTTHVNFRVKPFTQQYLFHLNYNLGY